MKRVKDNKVLAAILALVVFVAILKSIPFESKSSPMTEILYGMGESQQQLSEELTEYAVSGVEGKYVGEHEIKGANWAIPNIIRHILGVDE